MPNEESGFYNSDLCYTYTNPFLIKLTELMIQHNVGVSTRESYEIKEIDSDYFEN